MKWALSFSLLFLLGCLNGPTIEDWKTNSIICYSNNTIVYGDHGNLAIIDNGIRTIVYLNGTLYVKGDSNCPYYIYRNYKWNASMKAVFPNERFQCKYGKNASVFKIEKACDIKNTSLVK